VRGRALTLKGRVAAARDSVDVAVDHLRRGLDMINAVWYGYRDIDRYWLAQLLEEQPGGEEEAISIYGSLYSNVWLGTRRCGTTAGSSSCGVTQTSSSSHESRLHAVRSSGYAAST
jgi:hypothetical protein